MSHAGKWTREVHEKARILYAQLAALQGKVEQTHNSSGLISMLSEPYFQLLQDLFTEELPWAQAMDNSDLVMRLKGPAADEEAPRVKLIADTFESMRDQIRKIAKSIAGVSSSVRGFPDDLDLGLSGFARGSVVLGLKVRGANAGAQATLLDESDPLLLATRDAVRKLGEVSRFVERDRVDEDSLMQALPDAGVRDTVMGAAAKIAPTGQKGIDAVEVTIPAMIGRQQFEMTPKTRAAIRQAMARPIRRTERAEFLGTVRELDLDLMRFELRRMSEVLSLRCAYADFPEEKASALLNATVRVGGPVEYGPDGSPRLLQVERLEIVQQPPLQAKIDLQGSDGGS